MVSARSPDGSEAGSPALPPTPLTGIKEGSGSAPTSARSGKSDASLTGSIKADKLDEVTLPREKLTGGWDQKESHTGNEAIRTWRQETMRMAALCEHISYKLRSQCSKYANDPDIVPASFAIPISLILVLTRLLLQPIYNSTPFSLHPILLYVSLTILPTILIWHTVRFQSPRSAISARVCLSVSALGGDLVAISGRRVGSLLGKIGGPEWGALGARIILGLAVVGGGLGFAVLCSVSLIIGENGAT